MRKILGLFFSHSMMLFCGDVTHLCLCNAAQAAASEALWQQDKSIVSFPGPKKMLLVEFSVLFFN